MKIKSLKAKYACPRCNGYVERTIDNCAGSSQYETILKVMLKDPMKCGICVDQLLKISRLSLFKDRQLRRVSLQLQCKDQDCGILFESTLVLPLAEITRACEAPAIADGFGLSCPKCEGEDLMRIRMHVGIP